MDGGESQKLSPWAKGFVAGVFFCQLNRRMMAGVVLGTIAGVYLDQSYVLPDAKTQLIVGLAKIIGAGKNFADQVPTATPPPPASGGNSARNRRDRDEDD